MLLTRSPLEYPASRAFPFDLHVLSTPPAFVLSQDQTLHKKNFRTKNPEKAVKSPNLTKRTNHHKPTKAGPCWRPKITTKKNKLPPQPDGAQKGDKKLNTITCQPIHQCSRNTKQYSKRCVFQHLTGTHQPTSTQRLPANRPINTQPCTQK